jgi:aminopeptidase N
VTIILDRAYQPNDTLNIIIDYHTNGTTTARGIGGFGRGLTFIKPNPDDPTRPRQIWSQGETEYNHYWFPGDGHPNDFTTTAHRFALRGWGFIRLTERHSLDNINS